MKSHTASFTNLISVKPFNNSSNANLIDAEFYSENQQNSQVLDLYLKYDDEPDFDCEFLQDITHDSNENVIDVDSEEDLMDDYNDDQWDAEIYDPYLESTYY